MKEVTKKILAGCLSVSMAGLCACSSSAGSAVEPTPDAPAASESSGESVSKNPGESIPESSDEIRLLTDVDGFVSRNSVGTESGYYEMEWAASEGVNIFYTDYAKLSKQYLCADPMCAHDSESCTSYLSSAGALFGLFVQNDKLYIYNMPMDSDPLLYQCEMDGSNRVPFFTFTEEHDVPKDAIAGDDDCLYYLCEDVEGGSATRITVQKLDCSTKQTTELIELSRDSSETYFLVGAHDRSLILKRATWGETAPSEIYRYDVDNNELVELVGSEENNIICGVSGDHLLYWDSATQDVHCFDLTNHQDTIVYSDPILGPHTAPVVNGTFDDHLIMMAVKSEPIESVDWDSLPEGTKAMWKATLEEELGYSVAEEEVYPELVQRSSNSEYGIEISNFKLLAIGPDETKVITLNADEYGSPITVLAETQNDFLVYCGYEETPETFSNEDGSSQTETARSVKTALISKENFYHNVAEYRVIAQ